MNNYVLLSGSCEDCAWNVDNHYNPMCAHCPNCTYSKYDSPMFVKREQEGKRMISYDRLLELARKMHLWIFLHTADEFAVYKELGLTDEESAELGSIGKVEMHIKEENDG